VSAASLADVQQRTGCSSPLERFRPNIVVSTAPPRPYVEDEWRDFSVGPVRLRNIFHCTRCTVTTVDPSRPEAANAAREPLQTLRTYRLRPELDERYGSSPIFGIKVGYAASADASAGAVVRVGDAVVA
jgi:uncharacterized protein